MTMRGRWTTTEPKVPSLPGGLADACTESRLKVVLANIPSAGALLTKRLPESLGGRFWLVIHDEWPEGQILGTVRQALSDLGHPRHAHVDVEPFGFLSPHRHT